MKSIVCPSCGGNEWTISGGYKVCSYCNTKFTLTTNEMPARQSDIAIDDDVAALLQKCKTDPMNAKRYANLILDIDDSNAEALAILSRRR